MAMRRFLQLTFLLLLITQVGCQGSDPEQKLPTPTEVVNSAEKNPADYFTLGQELGEYQSWDLDLGDLNGDGYLDLFIASLGQDDPKVWYNDGSGNLSPGEQEIPGCSRAELGDVNGDGWLDIIIAEWDSTQPVWTNLLSVWLGGEGGNFSREGKLPVGDETQTMLLGDFNDDQALDLYVLGVGQNQVWLNDGMGQFERVEQNLATGLDSAGAVGDLDGDGDQDILTGGWEGPPSLWLNDGVGYFTRVGISIIAEDLHIHGMAVGDLDGDGDLDAFVTLANRDPHQIWKNDGSGGFSISQSLPAPLGHTVALGDLDGDGDLDAVTGHGYGSTGSIHIWMNDGKGVFWDSSLILGDFFTGAVIVGDLDLDGDLDLVSAQSDWEADVGPPDLIWLNQNQLQYLQGPQ